MIVRQDERMETDQFKNSQMVDGSGQQSASGKQRTRDEQEPGGDWSFDPRPSPLAISCPFCESDDVELASLFGSQLLTTQYYCRKCRTIFEQVKR